MTMDEADPAAMSAGEINAAIARELGWTHVRERNGHLVGNAPETPNVVDDLPNWAGNIAAAWELLAHLEETDRPFSLHDIYDEKARIGYRACLLMDGAGGKIAAEADTAPLAICRAFLAARRGA